MESGIFMSTTSTVSTCTVQPMMLYNVCFLSDNKRLDEWVSEERADLDKIQLPRKESKLTATSKNSRAASPDVACTPPDLNSRRLGTGSRKRKIEHNGSEVK